MITFSQLQKKDKQPQPRPPTPNPTTQQLNISQSPRHGVRLMPCLSPSPGPQGCMCMVGPAVYTVPGTSQGHLRS